MLISIRLSALRESPWHEYVLRFAFGGLATVLTGVLANRYGPVIGGLFLAFPAIFPASATLVEKHERKRKEERGMRGVNRARAAVALDASGAALGSIGLFAFGGAVWLLIPQSVWLGLAAGTIVWISVSILVWSIRKNVRLR
jgi:MFS family permease